MVIFQVSVSDNGLSRTFCPLTFALLIGGRLGLGPRPARLECATSRASRDSRARRPPARRGAAAVCQPSPALPPSDGSAKKAATAASASERASALSSPLGNRVQLSQHCDGPTKSVRTGHPGVADGATGTTIWADHQLGARTNGPPLRRLGDGSDRLPVAEFLSELPDALGAAFRD